MKPCPFCGCALTVAIDVAASTNRTAVGCHDCGAIGPDGANEQDAALLWDTRASIAIQRPTERQQVAHEQ